MSRSKQNLPFPASIISSIKGALQPPQAVEFDSLLRKEYGNFRLEEVLVGAITRQQHFACIRAALESLHLFLPSRQDKMPWDKLFYTMLTVVENSGSHPKPAATPAKPIVPTQQVKNLTISEIPATGSNEVVAPPAAAKQVSASVGPVPENLLQSLEEHINRPEPLYKVAGQQYVKCNEVKCTFCTAMFTHLTVTPCARFGHSRCTPTGWFPHVGITMWKKLRRQHDDKAVFHPQPVSTKPGEQPSLEQLRQIAAQTSRSKRPASPAVDAETSPKRPWLDDPSMLDLEMGEKS